MATLKQKQADGTWKVVEVATEDVTQLKKDVTDRLSELNDVDAVQLHERQNGLATELAKNEQHGINVKKFGLNKTSVQQAVEYCMTENVPLFIPNDVQLNVSDLAVVVDRDLTINGKGKIIGDGNATVFRITKGNLNVNGVTFENCGHAIRLDLDENVIVDSFNVSNCNFKNVIGAIYALSPRVGSKINNVVIQNNKIFDAERSIHLLIEASDMISILYNQIERVKRAGIRVGSENRRQLQTKNVTIRGNVIKHVRASSTSAIDANGIQVMANQVVIDGNHIEDVKAGLVGINDGDSEGIYTKAVYQTIVNNILIDAGRWEGAICVKKGETQVEEVSKNNVIVSNNNIYFSQNLKNIDGLGDTTGIKITSFPRNIIVSNNMIQGASDIGIYIDGISLPEGKSENVVITGNIILDTYGCSAILARLEGDGLLISDNYIKGVLGNAGKITTEPRAILVDVPAGYHARNISIVNNILKDYSTRGIGLTRRSAIGSTPAGTYSDINITGNTIAGAQSVIHIIGEPDNTLIANNVLRSNPTMNLPSTSTNMRVLNNTNYVTENSGEAQVLHNTITNGITVTHGLSRTPLRHDIRLSPINDLGSVTKWWVGEITATTFRIEVDQQPSSKNAIFAWSASANKVGS